MENRLIPSLEGSVARYAADNMTEQKNMGQSNFGKKQLEEAMSTFNRYRSGKEYLEARLVEEQQWWRRRHAEMYRNSKNRTLAGAQLFNAIENKVADIYDNIPDCSFLPRSKDDEEAAKTLTSVIPSILEQNGIEDAFVAVSREKVTTGTGIYAVTWDQNKLNGIGDVSIKSVSPLNIYWEPGITDIQESPDLFFVSYIPKKVIESEYPQLEGKTSSSLLVTKYLTDDEVDETQRVAVIDYYYKRKRGTATLLHYAKICCDEILYASEDDEQCIDGWYRHGKYPFVFDRLFPLPESPCGLGYISVGKDMQYQIDKLSGAITRNAIIASTRRKYVKKGCDVNKEELMDIERDIVEVGCSGSIGDAVLSINEPSLSGNYLSVLQHMENVLKEVTANRDFAQGGSSGGVTSGTAISALIESGNKQSRAIIRDSYNAYKGVVSLTFELYRQFGSIERTYRITGEGGENEYINFSNQAITAQPQQIGGVDIGSKEPVFDIMIRAHKKSPFARLTHNTMMQEFYGMGFFAPQNATQTLACLDGMSFEGKDELVRKISENGTLYTENIQLKQAMLRLAAIIDATQGTNLTAEMAQSFGIEPQAMPRRGSGKIIEESPNIMAAENSVRNRKAAAKAADTTTV